jgi:NHL repeat-containing protein
LALPLVGCNGTNVPPNAMAVSSLSVKYDSKIIQWSRRSGFFQCGRAYGNQLDDAAPRTRIYEGPDPQQFNTVHGIAISNDGIVYVGDRVNYRIQTFPAGGKVS